MAKRGMGRGLAAILPEPADGDAELRELALDEITPNPDQPRKRFDPESISRLAASLAAAGVIQPLVVRPLADGRYGLIVGERRWRAAREAELETVPALIRETGDTELLQTALIENVSREDLNPVDEARALAALVEDLGVSKQDVARRIGRSRAAVSNLIRLLDLPDEVLELLEGGMLSEGHGRALLGARGNDQRRRLGARAADQGWSVRETEQHARGPGKGRARAPAGDAEEAAALERVAEELESVLGRDVAVKAARRGIKAELRFEDVDEAIALAKRLRAR